MLCPEQGGPVGHSQLREVLFCEWRRSSQARPPLPPDGTSERVQPGGPMAWNTPGSPAGNLFPQRGHAPPSGEATRSTGPELPRAPQPARPRAPQLRCHEPSHWVGPRSPDPRDHALHCREATRTPAVRPRAPPDPRGHAPPRDPLVLWCVMQIVLFALAGFLFREKP
jgi:hypothetical protein